MMAIAAPQNAPARHTKMPARPTIVRDQTLSLGCNIPARQNLILPPVHIMLAKVLSIRRPRSASLPTAIHPHRRPSAVHRHAPHLYKSV